MGALDEHGRLCYRWGIPSLDKVLLLNQIKTLFRSDPDLLHRYLSTVIKLFL